MKRLAALILASAALAPNAAAQAPDRSTGRLALRVVSGLSDRGTVYVARGQRVEVRGSVSRFVPLQYADVEIRRRGRRVASDRLLIRRAARGGRFRLRFTARRTGVYLIRAAHAATPEQGTLRARTAVRSVSWSARPGAGGLRVRILQRGLARLRFVTATGGRYDAATGRAVLAFRKTNGMARAGTASRRVFGLLFRGKGGYRLKYPGHGKHVEVDLSRQVLVLARSGRPERIYHMSSGTSATPTVLGSFRFYLKTAGTNARGMVHSNYFIGGYAIHGYPSVPAHPASHGCVRIPIPNARSIFRWIRLGNRIDVYR